MTHTYQITQFDALVLPEWNPSSNMGTGSSLVSFLQLPGRGFYDNYGSAKSPQGIRPIDYDCIIYGETAAARRATLDALRAKLGVRGKLTVTFADDSLRWQWARLVLVDAADENRFSTRIDCHLQWITAAQHWYGIINLGDGWTWGDGSWVWGDGTIEFGENGTEEALTATGASQSGTAAPAGGTTQTVTVSNDGNIPATNVVFTITAGTTATTDIIHSIKFSNAESGYSWYYVGDIAVGEILVVNCGSMAVTNNGVDAYSGFYPSDKATWDALAVGTNTFTVTCKGNDVGASATVAIEYYDHWA